jgi:hypothetical protein
MRHGALHLQRDTLVLSARDGDTPAGAGQDSRRAKVGMAMSQTVSCLFRNTGRTPRLRVT